VRVRDGSDDAEAEAMPVAVYAIWIEALEGLEESLDFAGRNHRAGVRHHQHGIAVSAFGGYLDVASFDVVY
jgi:hypothetical protein